MALKFIYNLQQMLIAHFLDCEQNFNVAKHFSDMLFLWH